MNFNKMFLATPLLFSTMIWAQPAADPTLPHSESSFLKDAAAGGIAEVKFAELAEQNASNPQVKSFARRMVNDHSKMNDQLQTLASVKNVELPTDMGIKEKASYKLLSAKKGADFDRAYMSDMVKDHESDIKDFQKQAKNATDSDVRALASKDLPTLREHLSQAQQLASEIGASTK
jgi:putative membrane protein